MLANKTTKILSKKIIKKYRLLLIIIINRKKPNKNKIITRY